MMDSSKVTSAVRTGALALAAGVVAALAHPPFGFIVGILAYGVLMWLGDGARTSRSAFWRGWLCGLGYFAVSCWWIAEAFFVDAETFGWMAPFAVSLLAGGLALFWGVALAVYRRIAPRGSVRLLVFAGVFAGFEWLRGHIFTGFPWNLPGESWAAGGLISQSARLFNAYGMTWLTLALGATPALLIRDPRGRGAQIAAAAALTVFAGMAAYGATRVSEIPAGEILRVRVVQPDVPQAAKYDDALYASIVARYLRLTAAAPRDGGPPPQVIVWPEGALPRPLDATLAPGDEVREAITGVLRPGQILILGGWRRDLGPQGQRSFNSLVAVRRTSDGLETLGVYDKHHLVPFGEYVPRLFAAAGLQQLVPLEPFTPGPPSQPLDLGDLRIQPLICYEALFPGYVWRGGRLSGRPADVIVNISNDAWFGQTSGPWQHLNQARYRAIEEGLPIVRATPTGVSSVIDKYGRVQANAQIGLGDAGMVDGEVRLSHGRDRAWMNGVHLLSLPIRLSDAAFLAMLAISGLLAVRIPGRGSKKA